MKVNRKEMLNILGVKDSGLKQIEARKQLNKRLKDLGYKLIDKVKEVKDPEEIRRMFRSVKKWKSKAQNNSKT